MITGGSFTMLGGNGNLMIADCECRDQQRRVVVTSSWAG
jgi:hypothetical protein